MGAGVNLPGVGWDRIFFCYAGLGLGWDKTFFCGSGMGQERKSTPVSPSTLHLQLQAGSFSVKIRLFLSGGAPHATKEPSTDL
ncbi:hypothetical protein AMECASPLE_038085 [Ameca splendens]|uniref:Uncharacterized protein n=1 Tax=Ameca splendens TaxID=208324 RepID=A0ABV1A3G0_9TELE